jgi:CheY-like chemotaxis protein
MKSALIADDHPVVRAAVKILLKQEGFKHIHEASSGNEVLPMVREQKPDLLVLDLVMPSLDGLDVLARIQTSGVPSPGVHVPGTDVLSGSVHARRCLGVRVQDQRPGAFEQSRECGYGRL